MHYSSVEKADIIVFDNIGICLYVRGWINWTPCGYLSYTDSCILF